MIASGGRVNETSRQPGEDGLRARAAPMCTKLVLAAHGDVKNLRGLGRRHEGQTMTEYVAVLSVISIGIILALSFFGGVISAALSRIAGLI